MEIFKVEATNIQEFIVKINEIIKPFGFYIRKNSVDDMRRMRIGKKKSKIKEIIKEIVKEVKRDGKERYVTQKELVKRTGISGPTIRKYIPEVMEELQKEGIDTEKIRINGFLRIGDKKRRKK